MSKIRVMLADDHSLFRDGLSTILENQPDFEVVGEATNGLEAISEARKLRPDLIVMDVTMPICDGLEATRQIKQEMPEVTIVMLTVAEEDELLFEAIRNGAQGYLLKSIRRQEILSMLRGAVQGEAAITAALGGRMLEEFRRLGRQAAANPSAEKEILLSAREQEVLILVASGATNKEIAEKLTISIHTVRSHMRKLLNKLQLTNRREASSFARREGLVPPPGKTGN